MRRRKEKDPEASGRPSPAREEKKYTSGESTVDMRQRARDGADISKPTDDDVKGGRVEGRSDESSSIYCVQWSSASARDKRKSRDALECPGLAHDAVKDLRGGRKAFLEDPTIPTAVQQPRPKVTTHRARATQKLESGRMSPPCTRTASPTAYRLPPAV
jgi:hypothetical protein